MLQDAVMPTSDTKPLAPSEKRQDKAWMLSLYGTAIGAGTLFLPINAGMNGLLPLMVMAILAFPLTYYAHQALCRFVLSGNSNTSNITDVVEEHFGQTAGNLLTLLYFFAIYPILLLYGVAITNTTQSFLTHQLHLPNPPRGILALILIAGLMAIIRFGQNGIIKAMSCLVYPFIGVLLFLSFYLMPHWNTAILQQSATLALTGQTHSLPTVLWLMIPVMIFSFNHSPIISSFALDQKQRYGQQADEKSSALLKYTHLMMVGTVMLFVFSCVFSLSPHDLALAKQQNISILSYLANHFNTPLMACLAPIIAFIAISKSFLGHYLGASEGLHGLLTKFNSRRNKTLSPKFCNMFVELFIVVSCWITATLNPNILTMIETLAGPIIAVILFLMPMYAIIRVPAMKPYQRPLSNAFVALAGLIALSAILFGLLQTFIL